LDEKQYTFSHSQSQIVIKKIKMKEKSTIRLYKGENLNNKKSKILWFQKKKNFKNNAIIVVYENPKNLTKFQTLYN
jgi:hypothetical protein